MTHIKTIFTVMILYIGFTTPIFADRFAGRPLLIDTRIGSELSPINDGISELPVLFANDTFQFELFVDGGRGGRTKIFTVTFDNTANNFGEFFSIVKMEGILPQAEAPGPTSVKASADFATTVPASGYFATITLRVKKDLLPGQQIRFHASRTTIVDDKAGTTDVLSVGSTVLTFGRPDYNLFLDLNTAPGNQNLTKTSGLSTQANINIEIFAENIRFMTGFILRFQYDTTQLTFNTFVPGTLLPNSQTLAPLITQLDSVISEAEVTAASFSGSANLPSGLLGTITFTPSQTLTQTDVVMSEAEIRRGGTFNPFLTPLGIELSRLDADFNNDGLVNFYDFILFAEHFGSQLGDDRYSLEFDLVPDNHINFADFVLFTENLSFFTVTVIE